MHSLIIYVNIILIKSGVHYQSQQIINNNNREHIAIRNTHILYKLLVYNSFIYNIEKYT
jgi:hypothetical protein